MNIYCQTGLGNRVATIAACLKHYGSIVYYWRKNRDLYSDYSDVFPQGIPNVTFKNIDFGVPSTGLRGCMAYDYFSDVDYTEIINRLTSEAHYNPSISIHARFHRVNNISPLSLVDALPEDTQEVFVICDKYRSEIYRECTKLKIKVIEPKSREMTHDFDRLDSDTYSFIADWKTLCLSKVIVTNCPQSSALHPCRQKSAEIISVKI